MVTNVTINARTLVAREVGSSLVNGWITMDSLSDEEIDLLVEEYGHNWPEFLGLV